MTRCLRVRVGQTAYLVPAQTVGAIALYRHDDAGPGHQRIIDARRMATAGIAPADSPTDAAVAVEWVGPRARIGRLVLVDEVEGLVEIDPAAVAAMPDPLRGLAVLFDGFWHDEVNAAFLLRLRIAKLASFGERRELARLLAPLSVMGRCHHVDG